MNFTKETGDVQQLLILILHFISTIDWFLSQISHLSTVYIDSLINRWNKEKKTV